MHRPEYARLMREAKEEFDQWDRDRINKLQLAKAVLQALLRKRAALPQ